VLHGERDELSIIRMGSIDAVKVGQADVFEGRPQVEAAPPDEARPMPTGDAHPMPAAASDRAV
jgi:hypothetical protein